VVFKEKELHKNKSLADWKEKEKLQHSFEEVLRAYNKKSHQGIIPRAST
jgi:hypothetical protein